MPGIRSQDDGAFHVSLVLQHFQGFGEHPVLHGLPGVVHLAELARQTGGFLGILRHQQVEGGAHAAHAARRVQLGHQREAHIRAPQGLFIQPDGPHQGIQPRQGLFPQGAGPLTDEAAVLSHHGHDVRNGAQGHQRPIFRQHIVHTVRPLQSADQLEGHAHPGQTLEGIGATALLGVHHRRGGGQLRQTFVVIRDHHIDPQVFGQHRLGAGGDAAVHGDQEGDTLPPDAPQGFLRDAVALRQPFRDVGETAEPLLLQPGGHEGGGGEPVHVIVPVDRHLLPGFHRPADALHRGGHILQQHGIQEEARILPKEFLRFPGTGEPPGGEKRGRQPPTAAGPIYGLRRRRVIGADLPSAECSHSGAPFSEFYSAAWDQGKRICAPASSYTVQLRRRKNRTIPRMIRTTAVRRIAATTAPKPGFFLYTLDFIPGFQLPRSLPPAWRGGPPRRGCPERCP